MNWFDELYDFLTKKEVRTYDDDNMYIVRVVPHPFWAMCCLVNIVYVIWSFKLSATWSDVLLVLIILNFTFRVVKYDLFMTIHKFIGKKGDFFEEEE